MSARTKPEQPGPWRLWDVAVILLLAMLVLPGLAQAGAVLTGLKADSRMVAVIGLLAQEAGLVALSVASVIYGYGERVGTIGLAGARSVRLYLVGALAGASVLLLNVLGDRISTVLLGLFLPEEVIAALVQEEDRFMLSLFGPGQPWWSLAGVAILVNLVAPVAEEVFFRGFAYHVFRQRTSARAAIFASSALFASVHFYVVHFLPIFLIGIVLAYLVERYRSLVPSIVAHATLNLAVTVLLVAGRT